MPLTTKRCVTYYLLMSDLDMPPPVARKFSSYPPDIRSRLLELRRLIFATAAASDIVGELTETLKWGEPAYLTTTSKSGSTIRIGWKSSQPTRYAMYFNCNTTLVADFRALFPKELSYSGNRAILFDQVNSLPVAAVTACITAALTYHWQKRSSGAK